MFSMEIMRRSQGAPRRYCASTDSIASPDATYMSDLGRRLVERDLLELGERLEYEGYANARVNCCVASGAETIEITDLGRPVARLAPLPDGGPLELLKSAGDGPAPLAGGERLIGDVTLGVVPCVA
jgi:hypothetical protein